MVKLTGKKKGGILQEKALEETSMKKYIVKLSEQERKELQELISKGKCSARKLIHARILLKADEAQDGTGWIDEQISEGLEVSVSTIERVRRQFVEEGVSAALSRRAGSGYRDLKVDGEKEAYLIALACSKPPEGQARWTFRLLAEKMVELEYIDDVSHETVRRTLKKQAETLAKETVVYSSQK
jgi:transposase